MNKRAVILLSGGLDCAVSLAAAKKDFDVELALFFDYGQKSVFYEKKAAFALAEYYGVRFEVIDIPWLKNIVNTSLVNKNQEILSLSEVNLDDKSKTIDSMKNVWVSNRNSLFLNIAAAYCDSFGYEKIVIGANKEEATTFPDNSEKFINAVNETLKFSTLVKPEVIAPLINLDKEGIIRFGKELNLPFHLIRSCYSDSITHCGQCESCMRLKRGLERLGLFDILELLFVS